MRVSRVRRRAPWITAVGALGWMLACASPGMPPGGPPDAEAPALVGVSPDSAAVRVRATSVTLQFDEVVSEGASGAGVGVGASTLAALVLLSPGDGRERVRWRRTAIEIEPRGGFRANTTYRVTLLPGLADLRGNIVRESHQLVFSTGDSLTAGEIEGAIFDWVAGRSAPLARLEAFRAADTTFRWVTRADSSGRFVLRDLAPDAYHLRAWIDQTPNRQLDARESFDSITVVIDGRASADLYVFSHDTLGARIEGVEPVDSTALRVRFDRAVALRWTPDSGSAFLQGADSVRIPVGVLVPEAQFDSVRRAARAAADTGGVADTSAGAGRVAAGRVAAERAAATPPARAAAPADTARPGPVFGRAIPVRTWVLPLPAPLAPGDYRLTTVGIEGLTGTRRTSERQFRVREPAPPVVKDSTPPAPAARPPAP